MASTTPELLKTTVILIFLRVSLAQSIIEELGFKEAIGLENKEKKTAKEECKTFEGLVLG